MGQDSPPRPDRRVARIAGAYLLFALLWIWLSDRALLAFGFGDERGFWVGAAKGTAFVVLSAALLYWLVGREVRALARALALLRAVTEGTTDAVFIKDARGKYLLINRAGAELIGRPVHDILGADDTAFFAPETAERLMAQDRAVVASGAVLDSETDFPSSDGPRTFSATKVPYRDASGAVLGVMGISREVTDRKRAEAERLAHLRFFECLDRVSRALHGVCDLERALSDVLDVVLSELGCDRAWLVYPCDPDAAAWSVPTERTRPEYPGAAVQGLELPVTAEAARAFRAALAADGPVRFGPGAEHPLPADSADRFGIRSQLAMVLRPGTGQPWLFGLHQCSHPRAWAPGDERLFQEIGRRITAALTVLLAHRDLRASEERYRTLFDAIPVAVWEEDFFAVAARFERLRAVGVTDLRAHLAEHPWEADAALAAVRVLAVNREAVAQNGAAAKEELLAALPGLFTDRAREAWVDELVGLWSGQRVLELETETRRLGGGTADLVVRLHLPGPPDAPEWGRVIVTGTDVTRRKAAEAALRASQRQYQQLVATVDGIVWEVDPRTFRFTFVSEQAERLLGHPAARWAEPDFWAAHLHPDDRDWAVNFCLVATREHRNHDFEYRMLAADGRVVWVRDLVTVVVDDGAVTHLRGIMVDVTAQKRAEAFQGHQSRVLERIATGAPLADTLAEIAQLVEDELPGTIGSILLLDRDGQRLRPGAAPHLPPEYVAAIDGIAVGPGGGSCGAAARARAPVHVGDIATDPLWADFKHLALAHGLRACWSAPIFGAPRGSGERAVLGTFAVYARAPGEPPARFAEVVARAEHLAGVAIEGDRADRELRESEQRYRDLVELSPEGVAILYEGRLVYVNRAGASALGRLPADIQGRPLSDFIHPDDAAASRARLAEVAETGRAADLRRFRLRHADGSWRVAESCAGPCRFQGKPAVQVIARDATERIRAEDALREREGQLRLLVDHGWAAIAMVDADMRYVHTSRRWLTDYRLAGTDLTGRSHYEVFPEIPERWKAAHRRCLDGAEERCDEDRFDRADGTVQWLRWEIRPWRRATGEIGGLVMYAEDITARKRFEAHLQEATKMEAVGRLAGGIAHDFNNLLTVINGFSDLAVRDAPEGAPHRAALTEIRSAGERAARLTQQLLAYSRKAMIEPKVLDLNELVTESVKMVRLVGEDVLVAQVLAPGPVRVRADRGQLEQVLMNLVLNAKDAMPTGGRLTIETRAVDLGPDALPDDPDLRPGRYVRLTVADTGTGMTEAVRAKIFEPFFTTKGVGKGTGLGLAVVLGAVKQNGGHISVASAVGAGTTFTLLFPAAPGTPAEPAEPAAAAPPGGTETVLLVEDEGAVRAVTRLALEGAGYTVLAADGGPAALELADRHPGRIDILVTDVVMPHMGGRELAEALRARRAGVRVLFISGYTTDVVVRHGLGDTADGFLQKPYTPHALAHKVRELMDQKE